MSTSPSVPFPNPLPAPRWAGTASISGRVITRISGDSFAVGYPSLGVFLAIDPAALDGIVRVPGNAGTDALGRFALGFHTWFVDADHLAIDIDATYDLLIPPGTTGAFSVSEDEIKPGINEMICRSAGGADSTLECISSSPFTGATVLTIGQPVLVDFNYYAADTNGIRTILKASRVATVLSVVSGSEFTCDLDLSADGSPGDFAYDNRYTVSWQLYTPPPVATAFVKDVSIISALPNGSGAPRSVPAGFSMFAGDQWKFTAQVRGNTTIDTSVTWSCSAGSINSSGLYTAPSSPSEGSGATVTATSNQDGVTTASQGFQFKSATGKTVDINPSSYTPPSGWKLTGGSMLISPAVGIYPYLERCVIIPV